jgi:hypothetical protein
MIDKNETYSIIKTFYSRELAETFRILPFYTLIEALVLYDYFFV